jgi:D-alanyl-D-alanine carboxypeptidase
MNNKPSPESRPPKAELKTGIPIKTLKKQAHKTVYIARFIVFLAMCIFIFTISAVAFYINLNLKTETINDYVIKKTVSLSVVSTVESPCASIDASEAVIKEEEYSYDFLSDLSEYEEYMNPADRDAFIQLINYENTLDKTYKPDDLIEIPTRAGREVQTMRKTPAMALKALLTEAEANGVTDITVTSGWRSYNTQVWLLDSQVEKYKATMSQDEAYALAITEVAIPGTSEHQSGMCVDMHNMSSADIAFAQSDSAKWLADNCYKFGFIMRYPADKTDITKISFEPWHFRFVGRYHASRIHELGFCLEEYIEYLSAGNK